MLAPLLWLLKARPLVLVGALTLAAATFVAFEQLRLPAEISSISTFVIAFGWLTLGVAGEKPQPMALMAAVGLPLAALNAAVALGIDTLQDRPREALEMALAAALFGIIVWLPGLLFSLVFIQLPVFFGTRARLENNLDRRDSGAAIGAGALGAVSAIAAGVHLTVVGRSADFPEGIVNHVAFGGYEFEKARSRVEASGSPWKLAGIPGTPIGQIFVTGPEGLLVEIQYAR